MARHDEHAHHGEGRVQPHGVGALGGDKESFRQEFTGKGIEAILDTGGQATALKADGAFIETPGLSSTNYTDCPTDQ